MFVCMCAHAWECEHISMYVCSWGCVSVHEKATWQSQHRCHLQVYHPPLFQTESFTGLGSSKELDCWPMSLRDPPASASQCWVYKRMLPHMSSHMPSSYVLFYMCAGDWRPLYLEGSTFQTDPFPHRLGQTLCSRSGCHLLSTELSWGQNVVFISNV